jgi:IS30 family transposase
VRAFFLIPEQWKKALTVDNGKEVSDFKDIEDGTGMKVFFCDPYFPWQRETNENTNGLIRHYFPKGIDRRTVPKRSLSQRLKTSIIGHENAQIIRRPVRSF